MITKEERDALRKMCDPPAFKFPKPERQILNLLNALDEAEARIKELEAWGCKLVYAVTDGKLSKLYDPAVIEDEVNAIWQAYADSKVAEVEARAEKAERERDVLAVRFADNNKEVPILCPNGKHCCMGLMPVHDCTNCWLRWAVQEAAKGEE